MGRTEDTAAQQPDAALQAAQVLETVAGFYDFSDPKYIYVKAGQGEALQKEIFLHESFHRTYTSCTVYGGVFLTTHHFLVECGRQLERPLYDELLALRNKLIENMYFVQEGGAITRALAIQPYLHDATTQEQLRQLHDNYFQRLIPSYRQIGRRYTALLSRLFCFGAQPTSLILFNYANDALALFLMNASALNQQQEISMSPSDSILLSDSVAPDARFRTLESLLSDARVAQACSDSLKGFLAKEFGCQDCSLRAEAQLRDAMSNDSEHFEHRIQTSIHRALDAAVPEFAISLDSYEAYGVAANWKATLDAAFGALVPDYKPAKVAYASSADEKRRAASLMKDME